MIFSTPSRNSCICRYLIKHSFAPIICPGRSYQALPKWSIVFEAYPSDCLRVIFSYDWTCVCSMQCVSLLNTAMHPHSLESFLLLSGKHWPFSPTNFHGPQSPRFSEYHPPWITFPITFSSIGCVLPHVLCVYALLFYSVIIKHFSSHTAVHLFEN